MTVTGRRSIRPTYDSRETGPRFHVTYRINDHTITFQEPIADPFVRATVTVSWRDLLKALVTRRKLKVVVIVGGDPSVVDDVLELDANTLVPNSDRQRTFRSHINERLGAFGVDPPSPPGVTAPPNPATEEAS